jgi:hypothetical protein
MGKSKLSKLALAVAAAGYLSGPVTAALAYEMNAATVVHTIATDALSNRLEAAAAMIDRLRQLGITEIRLGDRVITLAELELLVGANGGPVSIETLELLVALAESGASSAFVAGTTVVASIDSDTIRTDVFPTGSLG